MKIPEGKFGKFEGRVLRALRNMGKLPKDNEELLPLLMKIAPELRQWAKDLNYNLEPKALAIMILQLIKK